MTCLKRCDLTSFYKKDKKNSVQDKSFAVQAKKILVLIRNSELIFTNDVLYIQRYSK